MACRRRHLAPKLGRAAITVDVPPPLGLRSRRWHQSSRLIVESTPVLSVSPEEPPSASFAVAAPSSEPSPVFLVADAWSPLTCRSRLLVTVEQ